MIAFYKNYFLWLVVNNLTMKPFFYYRKKLFIIFILKIFIFSVIFTKKMLKYILETK